MFHMPMSSPMMTTMLGLFSSAFAEGAPTVAKNVATIANPRPSFSDHFMNVLLYLLYIFPVLR